MNQVLNSQFVQIALPIVVTLIIAFLGQSRTLDLMIRRIDDVRDVLRAETRAESASVRGEIAKNHSELLSKLVDMENRLDRRIERLETARWKP